MQQLLPSRLGGTAIEYTAWSTESVLTRLHFVVRLPVGRRGAPKPAQVDVDALQAELAAAARSWTDELAEALHARHPAPEAERLLARDADAFPAAYQEDFAASRAVEDLERLDALQAGGMALRLWTPSAATPSERRLTIYRVGQRLLLSDVLPVLQHMGVDVVDERPYEIDRIGAPPAWIYDFGLTSSVEDLPLLRSLPERFTDAEVPDLPEPRPRREVWVSSPRVSGIHLRFGAVARGGLRWSDRPEDLRTEVLGLVKAQMVKNTVIVPTGAKGGFVVKQPPPEGASRDEVIAEGIACYRLFIGALLSLTDNLVDGAVVPPERVVRHDGDDTYLVVAADKGTATFSDIANEVALERGFWLGDAFASGGSVGYDHKAMGITARGAWESVTRHFRELAVDVQKEDFTVVGVG